METSDTPPGAALAHLRHELRTPLNQIIGYSELLIDEAGDLGQDGLVPDLKKIHAAGNRLLVLVNGMVDGPAAVSAAVAAAPPEETPPPDEVDGGVAALDRGELLVVDDNEANRDILARRLERQGYSVTVAEDGARALDLLADRPFDLILLDILMPGLDGYQVLARLKASEALRHIPVIMISALDELASVVRCIEMGAEDYLPKPFNPVLLRARIGACLEKKRLRDREVLLYDELQENYKKLKELERLRDDLTHMVVHDLRTPLTSIISGLQTAEYLGDLNADQREFFVMAVRGGHTLLGMINDLLDISKMEDGSLKLEYEPLDAGGLIAEAVRQVEPIAVKKNLRLACAPAEEPLTLTADAEKLRRTLVNLIGNATKFTPSGGSVTVSAAPDGDRIVFSVRDTGEGIPEEAFARIFEKFGQVEGRKANRKNSTGLGLTFCKMAVEAHGGHIWVESELGKGSDFRFNVPAARGA